MKLHPAAQILAWCLLVTVMQFLALAALLAAAAPVLLCALVVSGHKFSQLLRRTRWIMLSLLLIYAFSTPGEPLLNALGVFSPSREGVTDGVLQLTRLLAALAWLAILLDRLHRQALIAGLYTLLAPLNWIGLPRDRVAVRLALTLHYAEVAMLRSPGMRGISGWQDALRGLFEPHGETTRQLELQLYRFGFGDVLLLMGASMLFWLALQ
jgi:energy-coupling factor transport system permease protein